MDFIAHGLWAGAIYKSVSAKTKKYFKIWPAIIWSIMPDIFSFAPFFAWFFWGMIFGNFSFSNLPNPDQVEPIQQDTFFAFRLTSILYNISHSLFIFFIIFGLLFLIYKRPRWELGGWLFHILIDIPTHSYKFYPTPFLWPVSNFKFDGLAWSNFYFLFLNYLAIAFVYFILFYKRRRKKSSKK